MDRDVLGAFVALFILFGCVRWWFIAKGTEHRKYILLGGICFLATCILYITGISFDIWQLIIFAGILFLVSSYFLIKATIAEHRAKKKLSDR